VRAKRLPREVRERQILDAAVEVFSRYGYHSASMDEISEVAGISKPMIYTYLGSKEDLFTACIHRESTRLLEAIAAGIRSDLPPDVQLWYGLRSFFEFVGANRDSWHVLHRQARTQGGPFTEELAAMRSRAISLVAALLVDSAHNASKAEVGEAADQSGEALAAALVGAGESLADWWLDHPEESVNTLSVRLMNLAWMGFGDLFEGRVWRPPADEGVDQQDGGKADQAQP
jgi:AcrR family transcriptional regulator